MPGPFPGVDPYLESRFYWPGFHNKLVAYMQEALNAVLPDAYAADADVRVYDLPGDRDAVSDLAVNVRIAEERVRYQAGATAVLEPESHEEPAEPANANAGQPDGEIAAYPQAQREALVNILAGPDWERVVTVIEIVSPANNRQGPGRDLYLQKQRAILDSETHLLEIDLLRQGLHTVAAPIEALRERDGWSGAVSLHRSYRRYRYAYWAVRLRQPLPKVLVPLDEGVPDVVLDLQACYDRNYDAGAYRRRLRYGRPPEVPLSEEDAAWADGVLQAAGLRAAPAEGGGSESEGSA